MDTQHYKENIEHAWHGFVLSATKNEVLKDLNKDPSIPKLLGWCYFHGRGIEKNLKESLRFYQLASNLGDEESKAHTDYIQIMMS